MKNFIAKLFGFDKQIKDLDDKIVILNSQIANLQNNPTIIYDEKKEQELINEINYLKSILSQNESELEAYLNSKHPKIDRAYIRHDTDGTHNIDVRNFIQPFDYTLPRFQAKTHDEMALKCLSWVIDNIKYISDNNSYGKSEYWAFGYQTLKNKKGDCEDGSILLYNLMLANGIPYYRIRLNAGSVNGGGHCYVSYCRASDNQFVVLDWCIVDNSYTKVNTLKGQKRFSELKIGDEVVGYNENTGKIEPTKIVKIGNRVSNNIYKIMYETAGGCKRKILCTGEHPWKVRGKWVRTEKLKKNYEVYFISPRVFVNKYNRKEQYRMTSIRQTINNIFTRKDVRDKLSKNNCMKNPKIVEKVYSIRLKEGYKSVPELKFIKLCEKLNLPIEFVGDGSFWVKGKNPDFKVINEKKVIEVTNYGYLGRDEKWAVERKKHFEDNGFKCLIVFYKKHNKEFVNITEKEISDFVLNGVKILSITKIKKPKQVWNIHCEPHNNYFVNGLLSHNCYWPNKKPMKDRPTHKEERNYIDTDRNFYIWFSWNQKYTFGELKLPKELENNFK